MKANTMFLITALAVFGCSSPKQGDSAGTTADGADGASDGGDGTTTDGATDGADGATDGADGASDGTDGASDGTDGASDGTDGTADGTDGTTTEPCPAGMALFTDSSGADYCIDETLQTSSDASAATADCSGRTPTASVCTVDQIDAAVASGLSYGTSEIMTTEGEGCCCPGPSNETGHTCWEPTGSKCEYWPFVENHLCCVAALE